MFVLQASVFSGEKINLNLLNVALGFATGIMVSVHFYHSCQLKINFQLQNIKITKSKQEHFQVTQTGQIHWLKKRRYFTHKKNGDLETEVMHPRLICVTVSMYHKYLDESVIHCTAEWNDEHFSSGWVSTVVVTVKVTCPEATCLKCSFMFKMTAFFTKI